MSVLVKATGKAGFTRLLMKQASPQNWSWASCLNCTLGRFHLNSTSCSTPISSQLSRCYHPLTSITFSSAFPLLQIPYSINGQSYCFFQFFLWIHWGCLCHSSLHLLKNWGPNPSKCAFFTLEADKLNQMFQLFTPVHGNLINFTLPVLPITDSYKPLTSWVGLSVPPCNLANFGCSKTSWLKDSKFTIVICSYIFSFWIISFTKV